MPIANSSLRMQADLSHENKIMDAIEESTQEVKVQKEQPKHAMIEMNKKNGEILFVNGQNFEIS